jgi:hypothetical protein
LIIQIFKTNEYFKRRAKMKYQINYNTGAGNQEAETLEDAMSLADGGVAYTKEPMIITCDKKEVARRSWYGVPPEEGAEDVIGFGTFGHYGPWITNDDGE